MHFSERSDRRDPAVHENALGRTAERRAIAAMFPGLDPDRVAIAPSRAAAHLALQLVLADAGDELLVLPDADPIVREVAIVAGLATTDVEADGSALFDAATERTRAIVVGTADEELIALLAELDLPILAIDSSIVFDPIFHTERAPLIAVVREGATYAWLALFGPADRAEPLMTRLEWLAPVLFARIG